MRWTSTPILAAALLLLPAAASAQGARPLESDPDVAHKAADTNHDGVIDHEEYHHRMVEVFYFADVDRDGYLEEGEFEQTGRKNPREGDDNADGKLSMREYLDDAFDRFDAADTDGNNLLSVQEVRDAYAE